VSLDWLAKERAAFELLQWVPFSVPSEFDHDLAEIGYYSNLQRQRSDQAITAFDEARPPTPLSELDAFRELERLGLINQSDLFSPTKAKQGFYTGRLKSRNTTSADNTSVIRAASGQGGALPARLDAPHAGKSWRARRPRRRQGR
jgi:hypothetical protein